jgi:hypothetical protein
MAARLITATIVRTARPPARSAMTRLQLRYIIECPIYVALES